MASTVSTAPAAAGTAPPGQVSNFQTPQSLAAAWYAPASVLLFLMLGFLAVRFYVKIRISRKISVDDWTCIVGAVGTALYYVLITIMMSVGHFDRHAWDVPLSDVQKPSVLAAAFIAPWLSPLILYFIKLSFLLLYMNLFRPMRPFQLCCKISMIVLTLYYIGMTFSILGEAVPKGGNTWYQQLRITYLKSSAQYSFGLIAVDLVWDVFLLILPIAGVAKLQLTRQRKLGVVAIFATGILACAAAAVSLAARVTIASGGTSDFTRHSLPVLIATYCQLPIGMICLCMPSMAAFLRHTASTQTRTGSSDARRETARRDGIRLSRRTLGTHNEPYDSQRRLAGVDAGAADLCDKRLVPLEPA